MAVFVHFLSHVQSIIILLIRYSPNQLEISPKFITGSIFGEDFGFLSKRLKTISYLICLIQKSLISLKSLENNDFGTGYVYDYYSKETKRHDQFQNYNVQICTVMYY